MNVFNLNFEFDESDEDADAFAVATNVNWVIQTFAESITEVYPRTSVRYKEAHRLYCGLFAQLKKFILIHEVEIKIPHIFEENLSYSTRGQFL